MPKIVDRRERRSGVEERIVEALRNRNGIRMMDLAKMLGMYDSNLRKKIQVLVQRGVAGRYLDDRHTCVRHKSARTPPLAI